MFYFLRVLLQMLWSLTRPAMRALDEQCAQWHCVSPDDIDMYLHANNASYSTFTEGCRFDWFVRSRSLFRNDFSPRTVVLAAQSLRFRRSLGLHAFATDTRCVAIDGRDLYLEHRVYDRVGAHGRIVACHALAKMTLYSRSATWASALSDDARRSPAVRRLLDAGTRATELVRAFNAFEDASRDALGSAPSSSK